MSAFPHPAERQPLPPYSSDVAPEALPAASDVAQLRPELSDAVTARYLTEAAAEQTPAEEYVLVTPEIYIKALERARDHYRHRAEHDMLTGLVNKETWRNLLRTRLELNQPTGVVMLDLNSFKAVNDTLGHATGDVLLANFGTFLRGIFKREEDLITETDEAPVNNNRSSGAVAGRDGGDEFRILVDLSENNRRGDEPHARMDRTYEYLADNIATFVAVQPENIRALGFNVAIGAAVSNPDSQRSIEDQMDILLDQADESMYEDKPEGGRH